MNISRSMLGALLITTTAAVMAVDGDPDPTLGLDGRMYFSNVDGETATDDIVRRIVPIDSGFYVLGRTQAFQQPNATIVRIKNNHIDFGFTPGTVLFLDELYDHYDGYEVHDMTVDTQGRLVAVGSARTGTDTDILLCRILPTGTLDDTFGSNGFGCNTLKINLGINGSDRASSVALGADGRIIIAGSARIDISGFEFMVAAQFDSSGLPKPPFGDFEQSYWATMNFTGWDKARAERVVIDRSDRIVLGGQASENSNFPGDADFAIARLTPTGKLDPTFNGDGKITIAFDQGPVVGESYFWADQLANLAVLADGSVIAAGSALFSGEYNDYKLALAKLDPSGNPDQTFGTENGTLTEYVCDVCVSSMLSDMTLQTDGKFIVAGSTNLNTFSDFLVMRRLPDGTRDEAFALGGNAYLGFDKGDGDGHDEGLAIALQAGRPVVGGLRTSLQDPSHVDAAVIRLESDLIFTNGVDLHL